MGQVARQRIHGSGHKWHRERSHDHHRLSRGADFAEKEMTDPSIRRTRVQGIRDEGFAATWRLVARGLTSDIITRAYRISGAYNAMDDHLSSLELATRARDGEIKIFLPTGADGQVALKLLAMLREYPGKVVIVVNDLPQNIDVARRAITMGKQQFGSDMVTISGTEGVLRTRDMKRMVVFTAVDPSVEGFPLINSHKTPPDTFTDSSFTAVIWTHSFQLSASRSGVFRNAFRLLGDDGVLQIIDLSNPYTILRTVLNGSCNDNRAIRDLAEVAAESAKNLSDDVKRWVADVHGKSEDRNKGTLEVLTGCPPTDLVDGGEIQLRSVSFAIHKSQQ